MKPEVTPELIALCALQLRGMNLSTSRAVELARDVERLNSAALNAAEDGDFNDEPARFAAMLARLKGAKR
jgi:hypothetical protein